MLATRKLVAISAVLAVTRDSCLNRKGIRAAIVRRLIFERPKP